MLKRLLFTIGLISAAWLAPLRAQDYSKFNFNIGGGISTPLNPTGQYAGVSENFASGAGYNIDKHNSITGEFMWSNLPPTALRFIRSMRPAEKAMCTRQPPTTGITLTI